MTTAIIILFFMSIFVIAWLIVECGKPLNTRYLDKVIELEVLIEKLPVTSESCDAILNAFDEISLCDDKDVERNKALFVKFCQRFRDIWNERIAT
jgi:hypothetical protein